MAQKKRQDAGFAKLKKDLSENNLGNLYLFYGEEDYLRDYYIQQVQKKLLTEGMETFNLHQFQGKELDIQTLADCVDALPMMSERTVILVYDYDLFEHESRRDRLEQMFRDLPEYVCLIFIYDLLPYKSGGNTKLGKLLKKVATVVEFQPQQPERPERLDSAPLQSPGQGDRQLHSGVPDLRLRRPDDQPGRRDPKGGQLRSRLENYPCGHRRSSDPGAGRQGVRTVQSSGGAEL